MVGDRHEPPLPCFVFCSRLEEVKKTWEAVDFSLVEAEKEQSRKCCDEKNCLVRGRSPEEAWNFGVVIEVFT